MATGVTWLAILAPAALFATAFFLEPGSAPTHPFIVLSANVAMVGWFVGSLLIWERRKSAARWWAIGCGHLFLHVAIVFHLMHEWSQTEAFEHIRKVGGVGEGLYANYALMLIWLVDAAWLAIHEASYRRRPRWLSYLIYGYLLFMVFNGMVVYGTWLGRSLFAVFVLIAWFRWSSRLPKSSLTR